MAIADHKSRDELLLQKLRQIVLDNLSNEQFGVEELAQSYGISRSQLHRKLKKLRKQSISQFVREIRLEEALKLLKQDAGSVSEIAYQVGFGSATYFNTTFRNYFGYPPGEASLRTTSDKEQYGPVSTESTRRESAQESNKKRIYLYLSAALIVLLVVSYFIWPRHSNPVQSTKTVEIEKSNIPEKSIAILPLKNWTGYPDQEYISDGMTDAIISRLTGIRNVEKIVPFTSIIPFKNTDMAITEIGRNLGVKYILEGSLQRYAEDFKIDVRLVDATTNQLHWSESFSGVWQIEDIFDIQATIAENIARKMEVHILDEEMANVRRSYTSSQEAYNQYLRGDYHFLKFDEEGIELSKKFFKEAISIDPEFTDAYLRLATAWNISGFFWGIHKERLAWNTAQKIYEKALKHAKSERRKKDIQASYIASSYLYDWNFKDAKANFDEYVSSIESIDPIKKVNDQYQTQPHRMLAFDYARHNGYFKIGLIIAEDMASRNPITGMEEAQFQTFLGQNEIAHGLLKREDIYHGDNMFYLIESAQLYYYLNDYNSFEVNLKKLLKKFPDRPPRVLWLKALNSNIKGETKEETEIVRALNKRYEEGDSGSPAWFLALYYAHLQNSEKCFEWLQKSFDRHEVEMIWLRSEPLLEFIQCDTRYFDLYRRVGFLTDPPCQLKDNQIIELSQ